MDPQHCLQQKSLKELKMNVYNGRNIGIIFATVVIAAFSYLQLSAIFIHTHILSDGSIVVHHNNLEPFQQDKDKTKEPHPDESKFIFSSLSSGIGFALFFIVSLFVFTSLLTFIRQSTSTLFYLFSYSLPALRAPPAFSLYNFFFRDKLSTRI